MPEPETRSEKHLTQVDSWHKQDEGVRLCSCKTKGNASAILQLDRELPRQRFKRPSIFFKGERKPKPNDKKPQMIVKSAKPHFQGIENHQTPAAWGKDFGPSLVDG